MLSDFSGYRQGSANLSDFLSRLMHVNANAQAEMNRLLAIQQMLPTEIDRAQLFDLPSVTCEADSAQVLPVTVMFADLRGFTSLVEEYPPRQVIQQLNEYFACMTRIIVSHGGILDKYMGDEIMAYFECENPLQYVASATSAVEAGIEMAHALTELNRRWESMGWPTLKSGIGINSGPVLKGTIGSMVKLETTIIGDTVNVASRLQHLNKEYDSQLIVSASTYKLVQDSVSVTSLGEVQLRGRKKPIAVYAVDFS